MLRKRRSDRIHIVYVLTCHATGHQYVGVTAGKTRKALLVRVQKHVRRALTENRDWTLCKAIRDHGPEAFTYGILHRVRGKTEAHKVERDLINEHNPLLNTH